MSTFKRKERLKGLKLIRSLFEGGHCYTVSSFRVYWETVTSGKPAKFGVSVPKKHFPRAVDRNRLKRVIREAYRKHKDDFYLVLAGKKIRVAMMVVYTGQKACTYPETEPKIKLLLQRYEEEYEKSCR